MLGLTLTLSGALGRRTKHQQNAVSQLLLAVSHAGHALPRESADVAQAERLAAVLPPCIVQEDAELLTQTEYEPVSDSTLPCPLPLPMNTVEHTVLMAECAWVQASRAAHESTLEELETYVRAELATPQTWAAATAALRMKAKIESSKKRRQHQALMQLQALLDDVRPPTDPSEGTLLSRHVGATNEGAESAAASTTQESGFSSTAMTGVGVALGAAEPTTNPTRLALRLRGFWGVAVAPKWQLGVEVARALASLGLLSEVRAALWTHLRLACCLCSQGPACSHLKYTQASQLFEELNLWEEYVLALGAMGHNDRAEEYARRARTWHNLRHPACLPCHITQCPMMSQNRKRTYHDDIRSLGCLRDLITACMKPSAAPALVS